MEMRVAWGVVGLLWVMCGVAVAFSPPVEQTDGSAWSPLWGWLIVAAGVFLLALAAGILPRTHNGRHSNGLTARSERGIEFRMLFSVVVGVVCGAGFIWIGVDSGDVAVTSYGVVILSLVVFAVPRIVDSIHHLQDR
ncbi:hypothetical protein H7I41_14105 [Mycobacterium manitobense]|uniref:Uncharacterized protein n=1 Tax=[Mycobacterium] manitobense TaxID=190147 RepID=A0A9X3BUS7_9MYCO|nr:hypothetical protein [[Mycobacterium] manitobense]MCV7171048.1 hypothetical protein [[Mycobacterium] manitobense]